MVEIVQQCPANIYRYCTQSEPKRRNPTLESVAWDFACRKAAAIEVKRSALTAAMEVKRTALTAADGVERTALAIAVLDRFPQTQKSHA